MLFRSARPFREDPEEVCWGKSSPGEAFNCGDHESVKRWPKSLSQEGDGMGGVGVSGDGGGCRKGSVKGDREGILGKAQS